MEVIATSASTSSTFTSSLSPPSSTHTQSIKQSPINLKFGLFTTEIKPLKFKYVRAMNNNNNTLSKSSNAKDLTVSGIEETIRVLLLFMAPTYLDFNGLISLVKRPNLRLTGDCFMDDDGGEREDVKVDVADVVVATIVEVISGLTAAASIVGRRRS
ncbi:hypothetical protein ACFE04_014831 [Oxalis oulophora]